MTETPHLDSNTLLEAALVEAASQRWFPTAWPTTGWEQSSVLVLEEGTATRPTTAILVGRPTATGPWLQLPILVHADGSVTDATKSLNFWRLWLQLATLTDARTPGELAAANALGKEQSNSSFSLAFEGGEQWVAKIFRIVYPGDNPDVELPLALLANGFTAAAPVRAYTMLPLPTGEPFCSGVATTLVPNDGTAYDYFLQLAARGADPTPDAYNLGLLLGQMDQALQQIPIAEPPGANWAQVRTALGQAARETASMAQFSAQGTQRLEAELDRLCADLPQPKFSRVHGDLHLGQILHGNDGNWTIIDFEGEPLRDLAQRQQPDFRLRDLAGMLRSFHYAGPEDREWAEAARDAFLKGFTTTSSIDPETEGRLLQLLELEKALYEVRYEVQFRPTWLHIPLRTISPLLGE